MLGRHVYRVTPQPKGGWIVSKDGDDAVRGAHDTIAAATELATTLAEGDPPSKVVVEDAGGSIVEERSFGDDTAASLERAIDGTASAGPADGKRSA